MELFFLIKLSGQYSDDHIVEVKLNGQYSDDHIAEVTIYVMRERENRKDLYFYVIVFVVVFHICTVPGILKSSSCYGEGNVAL